jgi:kynurenine 3-monooxygenase
VVPFFGQGMNAAFEDCHMLYQSILAHPSHLEHAINSFAKERAVSTNTLADLCLQQYADMAHNTMSTVYLLTKKLQGLLYRWFPGSFLPLYSMVAFTNIPYHTAVERSIRQNRLISSLIKASFAVVGAVSFVAVAHRTKLIK